MGDVRGLPHVAQRDLRLQGLVLLFGQLGRHVGLDETGRHAVHGDIAAAQFARQRTGHAGHAGLGGSVVGLARVARGAHHAGDADDAPVALLHHGLNGGTADTKHRLEIGVEHGVPVVVLHAHGQLVARDAGVVHQHMQAALALDDAVDQRLDRCGVGHVEVGTPAARIRRQRLADARGAFVGGGRTDDLVAACGQLQRNGGANAARGAGDQRDSGGCGGFVHASSSFTSFKVAVSYRAAPVSSASMRLVRPMSTLPGPHSTRWVMPRPLRACTHSTQRTGPKAWR